jgi:uncharacterized phage protein gp47/JayE
MIFRKDYGTLVKQSLQQLLTRSKITNQTIGGIARSIVEVVNLNISEYYDILDINTAMGFVSSSEGYFLDLIADLFNIKRSQAQTASAESGDMVQKFYVATGTLYDRIPDLTIRQGTIVSTEDGSIVFRVSADTMFALTNTYVYVPMIADAAGSNYNVAVNTLTKHSLGMNDVFTTNEKVVSSGTDIESDDNLRYRIASATLSSEKANETAVRLACLSVPGVANVVVRPYARGIGSFDVIVIPVEGIASDTLVSNVQSAINKTQAYGITGTAIKPQIVTVDLTIRLVFTKDTLESEKDSLRSEVRSAIERYIVGIPIGTTFVLNELRQRIMDVSQKIYDHTIVCYYFRGQPVFLGNYEVYWDEMFYPNPASVEAVIVT